MTLIVTWRTGLIFVELCFTFSKIKQSKMIVYPLNRVSEKEQFQEEKSNIGSEENGFKETFNHFSIEHEFDPDCLARTQTITVDTDKV
jgi:hypothetical protein